MKYTIHELAKLSGVSTRTLRYYDQIGLLTPTRNADNKYRIYEQMEVDKLQQILIYRKIGLHLEEIHLILQESDFDKERALKNHLRELEKQKIQLETLIQNVKNTMESLKGERVMTDKEKFEGLKDKYIKENEKNYGDEIRAKYGESAIDESNRKIGNMSEEEWEKSQELSAHINQMLKVAFEQGDPAGEIAQKVCELHKEWICIFWKEGTYSKQAHMALAEGYVADERFTAYYDKIAIGCAKFLREAIRIYCS